MGTIVVRHPAVAGQFYPRDQETLLAELRNYIIPTSERVAALGCVVPHAGYMYSGHVAGAVYARMEIPSRCIVLCPNHTGKGVPVSVMSEGNWQTPLGNVSIDHGLALELIQRFPVLAEDSAAHSSEHAIEVQLPFLQKLRADLRFVPIAIGIREFEILEGLGRAIGEVLSAIDERVLVLASSDMNHYESDRVTRVKDHKAIEQILALNPRGLYDVVMNEEISMCGYGPTVAMLTAVKEVGATSAELVKYATSGDISGDAKMVVGYAGIVVR
jgi:AmmeMemoRadiSam system protein B